MCVHGTSVFSVPGTWAERGHMWITTPLNVVLVERSQNAWRTHYVCPHLGSALTTCH